MRKLFMLVFFLAGSQFAFCQSLPNNDTEFDKEYKRRIRQEFLFTPPVYIPKDLADAFINLNRLTDKDGQLKFKSMPEKEVERKLFFSFGRWIIENWGFYGGSRLSHYIKQLGVHHPEDMAMFVMLSYHRNLNKNPLDVKQLITYIVEKRDKKNTARKLKGTVIHQETRKREKQ